MRTRIVLFVVLVGFVVAEANAQNRFHRRRGTILGGLAGAAIGAAIGDKGDNETAGALIGGAVGAVAGGTIGNQKDQRIEQNYRHAHQTHAYQQQLRHQQAQVDWQAQQIAEQQFAQQRQRDQTQRKSVNAVSIADVIKMVRSGLGESIIVQYVQANGVQQQLHVSDIIYLHEEGVGESIINAMQAAPVAPLTFVDPTTGASSRPIEELPITIQPPHYGPSIVEPEQPTLESPLIDHTRPYVFPAK